MPRHDLSRFMDANLDSILTEKGPLILGGELRKLLWTRQPIELIGKSFFLEKSKGIGNNERSRLKSIFHYSKHTQFELVNLVLYPIYEFTSAKKETWTSGHSIFANQAYDASLSFILRELIPKAMLTKNKDTAEGSIGNFFEVIASKDLPLDKFEHWMDKFDPTKDLFSEEVHECLQRADENEARKVIYYWGNSLYNLINRLTWMQFELIGSSKDQEIYFRNLRIQKAIIFDLYSWGFLRSGSPEKTYFDLKSRYRKYRSNFGTPYLKKMKRKDRDYLKEISKDSFPYEKRLIKKAKGSR